MALIQRLYAIVLIKLHYTNIHSSKTSLKIIAMFGIKRLVFPLPCVFQQHQRLYGPSGHLGVAALLHVVTVPRPAKEHALIYAKQGVLVTKVKKQVKLNNVTLDNVVRFQNM